MTNHEHPFNDKPPVLFVPGGVTPVKLSYGPLLSALGEQIHPILKELEVYATDAPPPGYGLELEVEGIRRVADAAGVESFHLVGFSAGGASALAFTAKYPQRLRSLALIEPAWIGAPAPEDAADWAELGRVMRLPPAERMPAFMRWQVRPGVQPPVMQLPPGPPPPWMASRPAGLVAVAQAFNTYSLDRERFTNFHHPVYYAFGSLSTRFYERNAKTLAGLFPDMQIEEYAGRSHFDPPQRAEGQRVARALLQLWARSESAAPVYASNRNVV
jgi:pimeloyl-ACP methyl ester carboxylesterase